MSIEVMDVFITDDLDRRPIGSADYLREKIALQDLAQEMAERPDQVLPRLVSLAMEICEAQSSGISLFETDGMGPGIFRWHHLHGTLQKFTGSTTPRNHSPCGICLDQRRVTLSKNPERVYSWIADADIVIPEALLVPLYSGPGEPLGTLWVIANEEQKFDRGHARVLTELAAFAGIALRMIESERHLTMALNEAQTLADEMSHRVKNLFAITNGLVSLSARQAETPKEMAAGISGRLDALARAHAIVRKSFGDMHAGAISGDLREIITAVLQPYEAEGSKVVEGPAVMLNERSISSLALVLHELTTNAAKYGALKEWQGHVGVTWRIDGDMLALTWRETANLLTGCPPQRKGFGAEIVRRSVEQMGGNISYDWKPDGVVINIRLLMARIALPAAT